MYIKKILKKDNNIKSEIIIICVFSLNINDKSLTGRKPPEEIKVNAKFNESKVLTEIIFKIIKINKVKTEYSKKIFVACLKISELSNDIKLVNVFLKLSSYISIKKIIENKK